MSRISIIVPCYNVAKYLYKCLDSLVHQTYHGIEIILVDDGSPDNSGAICDDYAAKDDRVRVIHKKNGGVSAARNDGLEAATGDYVLFCDGDDWMPLDACELLSEAADETDADVIFGDIWRSWDSHDEYMRFFDKAFCVEDPMFIRKLIKTNFYYTYCPKVAMENRADGCYGGPWNKIVKRSLLQKNNIRFDLRVKGIYDDVLYSAYVLAYAAKIAYIGKPVYHYRQVRQSMTHVFKKNLLEINEAIFACWQEFMEVFDPCGEWSKAYSANVVRRLDHALDVYFCTEANPLSANEKKKELRALLEQEPYYSAVRNVEYDKLTKRHKVEAWLAAHDCVGVLWLVFSANKWRKAMRYKV